MSKVKEADRWECIFCKPFSLYDLQQKHKELFQAQNQWSVKSKKPVKEKQQDEKIKQSMKLRAREASEDRKSRKETMSNDASIAKLNVKNISSCRKSALELAKVSHIFERLISTTKQLGTIYSKVYTTYKDTVHDIKANKRDFDSAKAIICEEISKAKRSWETSQLIQKHQFMLLNKV